MILKIFRFIFVLPFREKMLLIKDNIFSNAHENITRTIRLIKKTVSNNKQYIIIDIGAFNGGTSIKFSKEFPGYQVISFEANPESYHIAVNKCKKNNSIILHNMALSNFSGTVEFNVTKNSVSSSVNSINNNAKHIADYNEELNIINNIKAQATMLDSFNINVPILLMKIDTQGHEIQVLQGAINTLKKIIYILVEMSNHNIYVDGCKYYEVDELLRNNGFVLMDIIITSRKKGLIITEYDAIYVNSQKQDLIL
jgi:FkbM family methyltransferase